MTSIEPLGLDLPMYDITTGTGDFIANGVVSHNCFARNTHTYLDLDAGHDFDSKIVVKVNAPELVRKELAAPKWPGEHIAMGTNVDVYQRAEGRYRLMPGILHALLDARNPYSILTKGTLILRDLDLLTASAEVTDVGLERVGGLHRRGAVADPGAGHAQPAAAARRVRHAERARAALRRADGAGGAVPVRLPRPAEATVRQVAEAGATHVSPIVLHLRPGAREWFLAWLAEHHPALVPRYRGLYGSRRLRAAGLPGTDRRAGARAGRAVPGRPGQPAADPALARSRRAARSGARGGAAHAALRRCCQAGAGPRSRPR